MAEPGAGSRARLQALMGRAALALIVLLLAAVAWQWRDGPPLSASLTDLLPDTQVSAREQRASERLQAALNRDLIMLVSSPERDRGAELLEATGQRLRASGLFADVRTTVDADLPALRQALLDGRLALLPRAAREQLAQAPRDWLEQRAAGLLDPFSSIGLVAPQQDWLGLAQRIQEAQLRGGAVELDLATGLLAAEHQGKTWFLLHARSQADAFDLGRAERIATVVEQAKAQVVSAGGDVLAASGLLYAAQAQKQASHEMTWLGGGALLAILALLLLAFRRWRVWLMLLPVGVGLLAGTVACVALTGNIHVLTLVVGSTLIGVATDYPLHYLGKSYAAMPSDAAHGAAWDAWPVLWRVLPGLTLSLSTSLIGYLALALTPFPALTQLAVFSAAGLAAAYASTVGLLPWLFRSLRPRPSTMLLRGAQALLHSQANLRVRWQRRGRIPRAVMSLMALALLLGGLSKLQFQDDLRNWISPSGPLLQESRALASITGFQPTSQFFLVGAADEGQLLERLSRLSQRLDLAVQDGRLQAYASLDQWVASIPQQQAVRQSLARLAAAPAAWQPLSTVGVPAEAIAAELRALQALPDWNLEQAMATPLGERWRDLWLGPDAQGVAAMVSLQGLAPGTSLAGLAQGLDEVTWVDRLSQLNVVFTQTRGSAALLKLLSCLVILGLLWPLLGLAMGARMLAVPLLAAVGSLATLGWLGLPLTLFGLFGLLLVTAIGVDYAVFMHEAIGGRAASLVGVLLAVATTLLSFGLLALSQTPAVSSFGLAVTLGIAYCFVLAPWVPSARSENA